MVTAPHSFFERIRIEGNPAANPASVVQCVQARFTVLTSRLIRLEWAKDGQFEDRATFAFPNRYVAAPQFSQIRDDAGLLIETEFLTLRYVEDTGCFRPAGLSITVNFAGQQVEWTPGSVNYGNLRGTRRTLDQCADAVSLQEGLLSRDGWTLFDDSGSVVWDKEQTWVEARPDQHVQDWYFFGYGHDYKALLNDYMQFGGAIPLVPRYVLGAWWSRFWAYHADDLKALVNDFQRHDVPLDVLVVDMDWHTPDAWTGYTWNRDLFPDPEAFIAWVHAQNLFVTLNLHPAQGVQKHEEIYPRFAQAMGRDPASGEAIPFDGADKTFIEHYFALLHHPMEDQGVDFWWVDWQQETSTKIRNLDPLPWLNHLHSRDLVRRGVRPMLYSRWGGLGNHRYPIGFSGDAHTNWESLAFQPYFTATAANVGYGWWSHDIGGHFGAADPELYARWVQFGAVSPCLRLHSTKDPLAERRPWGFTADVFQAAKNAMQFRYRLFMYLYSAARAAAQQGLSLCYPMYYDYPDSDDAYLARGQYFLGDQLIAAPIVSPADKETGLAAFDVWIPDGTWYDYTTLEAFTGPRWVRLYGDLQRIPLFARAGAIVPQSPPIMRTQDFDGSHLVLMVFPGEYGSFELYEDDGITDGYKHGECETTAIVVAAGDDNAITVSIAAAQGQCDGLPPERTIELRLRGMGNARSVVVNQAQHDDWVYDSATGDCVVYLHQISRNTALDVLVYPEKQWNVTAPEQVSNNTGESAPFVHCLDYTTFEDARRQTGTIIIIPPSDGSAFDATIKWTLEKEGEQVRSEPLALQGCRERQIINSQFHDEGDFRTFRWSVAVTMQWQGQTIPYHYQSKVAYPAITQWQKLIYNPQQQPFSIQDVIAKDGRPNDRLNWGDTSQMVNDNLNQPYGLILLEQERGRILSGEPLAACATTTIVSKTAQDAVLHIQHVGEVEGYLNGIRLTPTEPVEHTPLSPMFYTWMPSKHQYYALPLQPGENRLVIFSKPDYSMGWWGVGGTIYDLEGNVLT